MHAGEPPQIVVERLDACSEGARAEALFASAVAPSAAPEAGWVLHVDVERSGKRTRAEGALVDAGGAEVARRSFTAPGRGCGSLARALGVWAAVVLDERTHARRAVTAVATTVTTPPTPPPTNGPPASEPATLDASPDASEPPPWDTAVRAAPPAPVHLAEVGVGAVFMQGVATAPFAGASAYGAWEVAPRAYVRPGVLVARTANPSDGSAVNVAGLYAVRVEGCRRVPGFYQQNYGLQIDLCAGLDGGAVHIEPPRGASQSVASRTIPLVSIGPAVSLGGELPGRLAVHLRGVGYMHLARPAVDDGLGGDARAPIVGGRAELVLAWGLP